MPVARLLFASPHCLLDPASGAAVSTLDLLQLLSARGGVCAALCGRRTDANPPAEQPLPFPVELVAGLERSPAPLEAGRAFLERLERTLAEFRPGALLTYGGDWIVWELIARARARGVRVVFGLHNLSYHDARPFAAVEAIQVPSEFAADHYRRTLGLDCIAIPGPWSWERVCCVPEGADPRTPTPLPQGRGGKYVTFVNPILAKGLLLAARIIHELGRRRPDIPFLIVEGRGRADNLGKSGLDLGQANFRVQASTADPRGFYRQSRIVLLPSLWPEPFGRVAVESLINGIPVLGSRRGGIPEALAEAGFLFDVPDCYTEKSLLVPTAAEAAPWIGTIIRLWDDAEFYERERQRCLAAAEAWRPERLLPRFEAVLRG